MSLRGISTRIAGFSLLAALAAAQEGPAPEATEPGLMLTSRALLNQQLHASDGSAVGSVEQLLIDAGTGAVRFVAADLGDRVVAIAWRDLRVADDGRLQLAIPTSELDKAPALERSRLDQPTLGHFSLAARAVTQVRGVIEEKLTDALSEDGDDQRLSALVLATDKLHVRVLLAPEDYLRESGLGFEQGEWLEVEGVQSVVDGEPTLIAYEVRLGEDELRLRESDGTPLWER